MWDTLQILFGLFGGLAIFIYGMNLMSESLQKAAGDKMKKVLELLTKNRFLGVLAGALTTAVLQSSSATTVMAIGFVSAGLMDLPQAISIIFGANIGTTMTAQIIAFKITDYIYLFIFVGFIISFILKTERAKSIGNTIFAFGLLFLGIETMGDVMKPLASSPIFLNMIGKVVNIPILGVAVGTLMTLVVQSSSATIAVLQNFATQAGPDGVNSIIGLAGAIPILLGDNIGTTITALLASIGQSKDAKRTALAHCIFNISGSFVFIWFVKPYAALIKSISTKGPEVEVISRQIANAHTGFNLTMTIIWTILLGVMVKIVMMLIPDKDDGKTDPAAPLYLDKNLIAQPTAALQLVAKEVIHCSELVKELLDKISVVVKDEKKSDINDALEVRDIVHGLNEKITEYLADLFSHGVLTEEQATHSAQMMYFLSDLDRVGAQCGDIALSVIKKRDRKYKFSKEAVADLSKSLKKISEMYSAALRLIEDNETINTKAILKQKEEIMDLDIKMRKSHMKRVSKKKCSADLTGPFTEFLHSIDRMGNSCVNIVETIANQVDFRYFLLECDTEA